jgi:hypothetical protein
MIALQALNTKEFADSNSMAKDFGRVMSETVCHRRAIAVWQALRGLRVRLLEQGE